MMIICKLLEIFLGLLYDTAINKDSNEICIHRLLEIQSLAKPCVSNLSPLEVF